MTTNNNLPVGFDLSFPTDLTEDAWIVIRRLQKSGELQELCPSKDHWSFTANSDFAQRIVFQLNTRFGSIKAIGSD